MKINWHKLNIASALFFASMAITSPATAAETKIGAVNAQYGIIEGSNPHEVYSELVMGPNVPVHNSLIVFDSQMRRHAIQLQVNQFVFEGLAPFLSDLDADGLNEVIVTEVDKIKGSSLAVYGFRSGKLIKIAQNKFLGKRPQWLSKAGIADFDGDGVNEIAIVEKPHGGNNFAIWKLKDRTLVKVADHQGPTNHVEGTDHFQSALRQCGDRIQVVMSDHEWASIYALELKNGQIISTKLGDYNGPESIATTAASCG